MQSIKVRKIEKRDLDSLISGFCFPWSTVEATTKKWSCYFDEHQKQLRSVFVIEKDGEIFGYASLLYASKYANFKNNGIPEIKDVWISKSYRGKGFGTMLIKYLEQVACSEGYNQVGIAVGLYADYGVAQKLYWKLGYRPDGKGITYGNIPVVPGEKYSVDDDLVLWMMKSFFVPMKKDFESHQRV